MYDVDPQKLVDQNKDEYSDLKVSSTLKKKTQLKIPHTSKLFNRVEEDIKFLEKEMAISD